MGAAEPAAPSDPGTTSAPAAGGGVRRPRSTSPVSLLRSEQGFMPDHDQIALHAGRPDRAAVRARVKQGETICLSICSGAVEAPATSSGPPTTPPLPYHPM